MARWSKDKEVRIGLRPGKLGYTIVIFLLYTSVSPLVPLVSLGHTSFLKIRKGSGTFHCSHLFAHKFTVAQAQVSLLKIIKQPP